MNENSVKKEGSKKKMSFRESVHEKQEEDLADA
jgi:hypothetical protein